MHGLQVAASLKAQRPELRISWIVRDIFEPLVRICEVVDRVYVEALSLWRFRKRREDLSVWDFFWALAKLGGHLNRKQDKRPGWLVLWRGWTKLQLLVEGMVMTRGKR